MFAEESLEKDETLVLIFSNLNVFCLSGVFFHMERPLEQ